MAEGFARRYGSDVMTCESAGLAPAAIVQSLTKKVMEAKNIRLDDHYPKNLEQIDLASFDLMINMSGRPLPDRLPIEMRQWKIEDPIGQSEELYITVCDQIEYLVMQLILEFRREARKTASPNQDRRFFSGVVRRR